MPIVRVGASLLRSGFHRSRWEKKKIMPCHAKSAMCSHSGLTHAPEMAADLNGVDVCARFDAILRDMANTVGLLDRRFLDLG